MIVKKGTKKGENTLNNLFPDPATESAKAGGSQDKDGRLADITPGVEVVTMPASAAGRATAKAEGTGEVLEKDVGDKIAVDEMIEDSGPDIIPEDEVASLPDTIDESLPAEEKDELTERSDSEIAEALEQNEERKSDILIGLGFNKYDDNDGKIKYSILENDIKIGVTFDGKSPEGNVWAIYHEDTEDYKKGAADEGKKGTFLSPTARSQQPLLQKYYSILKGEEPIPKPIIVGKVVDKRGGSIGIEFEEEVGGPRTEYYPARDAVKRDQDGYFIAKGFSKEWGDRPAKMHFPRAIRLPSYDTELKGAPVSEPSSQQPSKPDRSTTPTTAPVPKAEDYGTPTVTLEEKRRQISDNLNWAVGEAVNVYKEHVLGQVPIEGDPSVFIEKIAVTAFLTLQKSLKCVEG